MGGEEHSAFSLVQKSCSFCYSPGLILFWIAHWPGAQGSIKQHLGGTASTCGLLVWAWCSANIQLFLDLAGAALLSLRQFWLQLTWHSAHNEWVIQKLLQDSSWQSWFWIQAFWISVQRNLWISWQLEKKSVGSNFLWIEKGEEEDYQWCYTWEWKDSDSKVTFILFSVHWLYLFGEKSVKEHHNRLETKRELLLLLVWSGFFGRE